MIDKIIDRASNHWMYSTSASDLAQIRSFEFITAANSSALQVDFGIRGQDMKVNLRETIEPIRAGSFDPNDSDYVKRPRKMWNQQVVNEVLLGETTSAHHRADAESLFVTIVERAIQGKIPRQRVFGRVGYFSGNLSRRVIGVLSKDWELGQGFSALSIETIAGVLCRSWIEEVQQLWSK